MVAVGAAAAAQPCRAAYCQPVWRCSVGVAGPAGGSVPTAAAKLPEYIWLEPHKRALVTQGVGRPR